MENREQETFNYTYSAKEQNEIQNIRKKYEAPKEEENKMERLRKLDAGVTNKATTMALILGIVGALLLGFGMSLAMSELNEMLGLGQGLAMVVGIIVGIIGIALICVAYPVYNYVIKKERAKVAPEILRLTEELLK